MRPQGAADRRGLDGGSGGHGPGSGGHGPGYGGVEVRHDNVAKCTGVR
jgi:hypothetical protein